nr:hypothetical protein [Tanacetum cinerariifolium]
VVDTGSVSEGSAKKKGRTVAVTTEDMQKMRNDTFGGNEATKKTKKNQLKQQYGNFKAERKETLEQTFNRLQAIIKYKDINQIDEDEIEEMDIKWNMALLTNEEEDHALVAEQEAPTEFALMAKSSSDNE